MKNAIATAFFLILLVMFCGCSNARNNLDNVPTSPSENVQPSFPADEDMQEGFNGNVQSGGYIAEHDGYYYYANQDDHNRLYRMDTNLENRTKLSDNRNDACNLNIQFSGNTLFYLQNTRLESNSDETIYPWEDTLYSYDISQHSEIKVLEENIGSFTVSDDWLYFSTIDSKGVYKAKLNGSDKQLLREGDPFFSSSLQVYNDRLFYCWDEALLYMDLDGSNIQSKCIYPYASLLYNQDIYYIQLFTWGKLCKVNFKENDMFPDSTILVEKDVLCFVVYGNNIYYSTFDDKIYRIDLDGKNNEFIIDGSAPVVFSKHLFYINNDGIMMTIPKGTD